MNTEIDLSSSFCRVYKTYLKLINACKVLNLDVGLPQDYDCCCTCAIDSWFSHQIEYLKNHIDLFIHANLFDYDDLSVFDKQIVEEALDV